MGAKNDAPEIPWLLRPILLWGYAWGIVLRIAALALGIALIAVGDTLARVIGACLVGVWIGVATWYLRRRRTEESAP